MECQYCSDAACADDDEFYVSDLWFPGATEILPFTQQQGCQRNWGSSCGTLMGCEGDHLLETQERVRESVARADWETLFTEVEESPGLYAVLPERQLLLLLAPGCDATPVLALHVLPKEVLHGIVPRAAGTFAGDPEVAG